ncbi:MAG: hypothetical protein Q4G04_01445 [bacterium]|nr:hypothetical protein [bacterium]
MKIIGVIVFSIFILLILFLFCAMFIAKKIDEEMEENDDGFNKVE